MLPSQVRRRRWLTSDTRKRIRKTKKIIFAIPAAATAIPEKPSTAAKSATIKNPNAQRSITNLLMFQSNSSRAQNRANFLGPNFLGQPRSSPLVRQRRSNFHTVEALRDWNECCSHHGIHAIRFSPAVSQGFSVCTFLCAHVSLVLRRLALFPEGKVEPPRDKRKLNI